MLDAELLSSVGEQMMEDEFVEVNGRRVPVRRTSAYRLDAKPILPSSCKR
jgi:hypothetical protein